MKKNTGARLSFYPLKVLAIFWVFLCPECVYSRATPRTPLELTVLPRLLVVGRGLAAPSKNPAVGLRLRRASRTSVSESMSICFQIKFRPPHPPKN